jgi:hypothetical protein
MDDVFISGTVQPSKTVGEPGVAESLIPIWGSGRSAVNHFQQGNYGRGVLYTALAITDVFLVKSLVVGGGKLLVRGGAALLKTESEHALSKLSAEALTHAPSLSTAKATDLVVKVGKSEFADIGMRLSPGVQLTQVDGWFVKRISNNAGWLRREWGALSLEEQYKSLVKLGSDMAPEFFIRDGMLFTKSVGATSPSLAGGTFWGAFFKGSYRMGTLLNDIRPRNMGVNGLIFDPAWDPLMKSIFWTGIRYGPEAESRIILKTD